MNLINRKQTCKKKDKKKLSLELRIKFIADPNKQKIGSSFLHFHLMDRTNHLLFQLPSGGFAGVLADAPSNLPILFELCKIAVLYSEPELLTKFGLNPNAISVRNLLPNIDETLILKLGKQHTEAEGKALFRQSISHQLNALNDQKKTLHMLSQIVDKIPNFIPFFDLASLEIKVKREAVRFTHFAVSLGTFLKEKLTKRELSCLNQSMDLMRRVQQIAQPFSNGVEFTSHILNCIFHPANSDFIQLVEMIIFDDMLLVPERENDHTRYVQLLGYFVNKEGDALKAQLEQQYVHSTQFERNLRMELFGNEHSAVMLRDRLGNFALLDWILSQKLEEVDMHKPLPEKTIQVINFLRKTGYCDLTEPMHELQFISIIHDTLQALASLLYYLLLRIGFCIHAWWKHCESSEHSDNEPPFLAWLTCFLQHFLSFMRLAELVHLPYLGPAERFIQQVFYMFPLLGTKLLPSVPNIPFNKLYDFCVKSMQSANEQYGSPCSNLHPFIWDYSDSQRPWRSTSVTPKPQTMFTTIKSDVFLPLKDMEKQQKLSSIIGETVNTSPSDNPFKISVLLEETLLHEVNSPSYGFKTISLVQEAYTHRFQSQDVETDKEFLPPSFDLGLLEKTAENNDDSEVGEEEQEEKSELVLGKENLLSVSTEEAEPQSLNGENEVIDSAVEVELDSVKFVISEETGTPDVVELK